MYEKPSVLVVGPDDAETGTVSRRLLQEQYTVITAYSWTNGLRQLYSERPNVLLLIADTRGNRAALRLARDTLASDYPLDTRGVLLALGACSDDNAATPAEKPLATQPANQPLATAIGGR